VIGETVAAAGTDYVYAAPSPRSPVIGAETSGAQGVIIGGPVTDGYPWWQVAFDDNLTGWTYDTGVARVSSNAPTLTFTASPSSVARGAPSTLTWASTKATSCSGVGFSPSAVSGSASVAPTVSTNYTITCAGSGGSTTRTVSVIVNSVPSVFTWTPSLPVTFHDPRIVRFGGTETRALLFMDGSLYAGLGDWEDPSLQNPQSLGAQVLRLDSPTGGWVEDQNFLQATSRNGNKDFEAVAAMGTAHFDRDSGNNPITPVDVLMAGFWNLHVAGLEVAQKTVKSGSTGAQGAWAVNTLGSPSRGAGQVRSFASYTDSITKRELAFAGSSPYGIFSGAFTPASGGVQWGDAPEAGTAYLTANGRVMSFAACGGRLYASIYDAIVARTDGENPSWGIFYRYSGPPLNRHSSGFRGLACVANLNRSGYMLIAALEGESPDVYEFPFDGSRPSIELHTSNFVASLLGAWIGYGILAYNNMVVYPQSGSPSCPDLLLGLGVVSAYNYPGNYQGYYPLPTFLIRHCDGIYGFRTIDPTITPKPTPMSTRALAVSQFPGDPAGTIYAGGYDARGRPAHNTNWIYRGVPQTANTSRTKP
jgi:hypothetical protein